jgi:hypothetical protein
MGGDVWRGGQSESWKAAPGNQGAGMEPQLRNIKSLVTDYSKRHMQESPVCEEISLKRHCAPNPGTQRWVCV